MPPAKYYVRSFFKQGKIKIFIVTLLMLCAGLTLIFSKFVAPNIQSLSSRSNPIRDITVIANSNQIKSTTQSLLKSNFRNIDLISMDRIDESNQFYSSVRISSGGIETLIDLINTTYVLFGHNTSFFIPSSFPKLPNKPQVIGYMFETCNRGKYTLNLPNSLGANVLTKDAFKRFIQFYTETLHSDYDDNEAFQIFADLHTLRLLKLPCGKLPPLPKWEDIEPVDEPRNPVKPWGDMELIPEVWLIKDLI
ncbi:hypothetical protein TVAG_063430 [Trichomonas vaginalis G3]|uniref:Uncharacterized protein n=1 Tax=Trichomonas vaginalis (strain ATCC PRA-98 / G3) TaxID=412133 RepID=A2EU13_TRIV3|nr:hypothetical protein TVAGG3_0955340 [Trichomonas vaginalis G3]EAY03830.1 hypothetical protein TVAG_063430 [Trichomonas vaginalis G3]KAI5487512.1 hypothetical protein TVAGG3_0955340 [Trichomonas vaginalis G3]|eukprot:XP_001316053.1 hypothetical protein [Trichomonas vaginalis G3]